MTSENLVNMVDQALIGASLLGCALAFLHHWRDGNPWSPLLCSLAGVFILFVVMGLGLKDNHAIQTAVVFLITAPFVYYLTGLTRYALVVRKRQMDLQAVWANVRTEFSSMSNPLHFWSPLSYTGYEKAHRRIEAIAKSADHQAALSVFYQLTNQHRATLERKKAQNEYQDEYQVVQKQDWRKHANYFITQVFLPELRKQEIQVNKPVFEWVSLLDDEITCRVRSDENAYLSFADVTNGVEYEHFVANILKAEGWTAEMTPGSGDHGADIIASHGGFRVAVQCKLYSSPVGNASVQEVYSAKDFYGCHYAVVVSNAEFTRQAKKISSSLCVALVHHEGLLKVINAAEASRVS